MRPFFKYFGSKWGISQHYPAPDPSLPIVEPFAGSAGYSTRHGAGLRVMLYDTSPEVVMLWRWLIVADPAEILALPVDPLHRREDVRTLGLHPAAQRLVQAWITTQGTPSNWRMTPAGTVQVQQHPGSLWSEHVRARIARQLPMIRRWTIEHASYDTAPDIEATWTIDPPYQQNAHANTTYKCAPVDFTALGAWCRTRRGLVMVHEQEGADWLPFGSPQRHITGACTADAKRVIGREVVWPVMQASLFGGGS